jgi:hypothetical protein
MQEQWTTASHLALQHQRRVEACEEKRSEDAASTSTRAQCDELASAFRRVSHHQRLGKQSLEALAASLTRLSKAAGGRSVARSDDEPGPRPARHNHDRRRKIYFYRFGETDIHWQNDLRRFSSDLVSASS